MAENKQELKIELTPEIASGHYSNLAVISHTPGEFFIDFINVAPNMPRRRVRSFGEIERKTPKGGNAGNNGGIPNPFQA